MSVAEIQPYNASYVPKMELKLASDTCSVKHPRQEPVEQVKTGECRQVDAKIDIPNREASQKGRWDPTRIMDIIDTRILEACTSQRGCERDIQAAREIVSRILHKHPRWPKPDAITADARSEIHIVWRSIFGKVEIDTIEMGIVEYYVTRTKEDKMEEGRFETFDFEEVQRVMSWLYEHPEMD